MIEFVTRGSDIIEAFKLLGYTKAISPTYFPTEGFQKISSESSSIWKCTA